MSLSLYHPPQDGWTEDGHFMISPLNVRMNSVWRCVWCSVKLILEQQSVKSVYLCRQGTCCVSLKTWTTSGFWESLAGNVASSLKTTFKKCRTPEHDLDEDIWNVQNGIPVMCLNFSAFSLFNTLTLCSDVFVYSSGDAHMTFTVCVSVYCRMNLCTFLTR